MALRFSKTQRLYFKKIPNRLPGCLSRAGLGFFKNPLMGEHNALNGLGALVCGWQAGLKKQVFIKGLAAFQGVRRRAELKGVVKGIHFFDDYAHHPSEIKAILKALKERFPEKRCVVLFQPHRYSRLKSAWKDFIEAFRTAESVYVSKVYPAGESPLPGKWNSRNFVKQLKNARFVPDRSVVSALTQILKPKDVFITLGAGSVYRFGEDIMEKVKARTK